MDKSRRGMQLAVWVSALALAIIWGCRPTEPIMDESQQQENRPEAELSSPPRGTDTQLVQAGQQLRRRRVAILIADGFHDKETVQPRDLLVERGAAVVIIGISRGEVKAYNSDQRLMVERSIDEVRVADFNALVIPGGESPGNLIQHDPTVRFVADFVRSGKTVAAICHGPRVLVAADVLNGRTVTAAADVADEIRAAGGTYTDQVVVHQGNLITSRGPQDIGEFSQKLIDALRR